MIYLVLLRSSIATLVAWSGGILGAALGTKAKRHLALVVNASLGALLAVTVFDILPDSAELLNVPLFLAAVSSGYLVFWIIGRYVYPICPACTTPEDVHMHESQIARTAILLMITLGLHSFMDGAAVVVADKISRGVNAAVFFAVSLHKFPEGLALILLLIGAGYRRRSALLLTIGIEATTEVGALAALVTVDHLSRHTLGLVFANIGGGFLYLVASAFISQLAKATEQGGENFRRLSYITGGFGFAAAAATIIAGEALSH